LDQDLKFEGEIKRGNQPVNGLVVKAVDPLSGRVVSTASQTGCVDQDGDEICGRFTIGLAPEAAQNLFSLHISRPSEPQYPVVQVPDLTIRDQNISVALEPLGVPVHFLAKVEGKTPSDTAPKCIVLFESDGFESGNNATGRVEHVVTTNESGGLEQKEGELGVDLYPQKYQVTVIPLEASPDSKTDYTAKIETVDLLNSSGIEVEGTVFSLAERPRFSGGVLAAHEGVPLSAILAERSADAPVYVRDSTAAAGSAGQFDISLDRGKYRVTAEAPAESGYAWGSASLEVLSDGRFQIELPLPSAARADLVSDASDAEGAIELQGAVVEWYKVVDGRGYVVARVTSDSTGRVRALLPP
jgi:hypothetical protein